MFSEELEKISWEETTDAIYSKTESDVLRALGKSHCDVNDFMALVSPAAEKYIEPMARLSRKYTEERFGKTISMHQTYSLKKLTQQQQVMDIITLMAVHYLSLSTLITTMQQTIKL